MSLCGDALAQAAQKLIGSPFRLHGRNRETGLDCIGVVGAALAKKLAVATLARAGAPKRSRSTRKISKTR